MFLDQKQEQTIELIIWMTHKMQTTIEQPCDFKHEHKAASLTLTEIPHFQRLDFRKIIKILKKDPVTPIANWFTELLNSI